MNRNIEIKAKINALDESQYAISRLSDPTDLKMLLTRAYGVRGIVRKKRTLYIIGRTRIHLDEVDDLGFFLELEVVLRPQESISAGINAAYDLMDKLNVPRTALVNNAYIDLVEPL